MQDHPPDQRLARIGDRLRERRQQLGLTQDQLAERLGHLNVVSVSMYERGLREPRLLTFLRLADALEIAPAELLGVGREPNPTPSSEPDRRSLARELRVIAAKVEALDGS